MAIRTHALVKLRTTVAGNYAPFQVAANQIAIVKDIKLTHRGTVDGQFTVNAFGASGIPTVVIWTASIVHGTSAAFSGYHALEAGDIIQVVAPDTNIDVWISGVILGQ